MPGKAQVEVELLVSPDTGEKELRLLIEDRYVEE